MKVPTLIHVFAILIALAMPAFPADRILIADGFESYSTGKQPYRPADGNSHSWRFEGLDSVSVVEGKSPDGGKPNAKLLQVTGTNASSFGREFDRQNGELSQLNLKLTFKILPERFEGDDYTIQLRDQSQASHNPVNIRIASNGAVTVFNGDGEPGGSAKQYPLVPKSNPLAAGNWYEFLVDIDLTGQQYSVSVTDPATGSTRSTPDLYFLRNVKTVDELRFSSNSVGSNTGIDWKIDDINLSVVSKSEKQ